MHGFDHVADTQGWNDATRANLVRRFIADQGLEGALADYARDIADTENDDAVFDTETPRQMAARSMAELARLDRLARDVCQEEGGRA